MTGILIVLGALAFVGSAWYIYWRKQARMLQTSGHTGPETSAIGKLAFAFFARLAAFLTVGPVIVAGKKLPRKGRILLAANHQIPTDFALLHAGARRHYRALGDAAQFTGFFGVLSAWMGIITVKFGSKAERAAGEASSVRVLSAKKKGLRLSLSSACWLFALLALLALCLWAAGFGLLALLALAGACLALVVPGGDPVLAVAPQGALMPDNILKQEEFRPGAVRIARAAAEISAEPVLVVPVAIYYERDSRFADWTHFLLAKTRSLFPTLRNPKHWNPLFKLDLRSLSEEKRAEIEKEKKAAIDAYKNSSAPIYGGVVFVGDPIDVLSLPEDPKEAVELLRLKLLDLLALAESRSKSRLPAV